jgi:ACS family glucarate transporter-like MFS transporter
MNGSFPSIPAKDALTEQASGVRWRIVGLLMAGSFLSWFNRVSMSVAGTERIMDQYGISPTQMGLVYSALLLAYAACMTPGGFLIDARGAWATLALMGIGSGLFVIATGISGWVFATAVGIWLALVVIRAVAGIFMAPIYPASGRIIRHWLPLPQRAWANGMVNGAAPAGIACTFLGFGALIDWFDWPTAFIITGIATVLLGVVWILYARDDPHRHPGVNAAELRVIERGSTLLPVPTAGKEQASPSLRVGARLLLQNRSLMLLTLSYAAIGYFEYLFYFWTQFYFDDALKMGKETSRLYSTILNLAMAAGMGVGGLLSDRLMHMWGYRWGRAAVPIGGMTGSAVLLLVGISVSDPVVIVVCFALALAAIGACEGPCWATAIELGGRRGGAAAGIFNTGGNLGGLLAPTLTPWISGRFGWGWGIALGSIACLLGVGLWLGVDPSERVPEPDVPPGDKTE